MTRESTWTDGLTWTAVEEDGELVFRGAGHHTLPLAAVPRARERAALMAARDLPVIESTARRQLREPVPAAAEPEYGPDLLWGL